MIRLNHDYKLRIIISRRIQAMAGARFIARVIDNNSNVTNHVETEMIVVYEDYIYSFT